MPVARIEGSEDSGPGVAFAHETHADERAFALVSSGRRTARSPCRRRSCQRLLPGLLVGLLLPACGSELSRPLNELTVVDSVYVDPETDVPFSGRVERRFEDDTTVVQIEGALLEGVWNGEMIVYHPNGRVRYMGSFIGGERCGPWVENADSTPTASVYEDLVREVETLGLYPPCDGSI